MNCIICDGKGKLESSAPGPIPCFDCYVCKNTGENPKCEACGEIYFEVLIFGKDYYPKALCNKCYENMLSL